MNNVFDMAISALTEFDPTLSLTFYEAKTNWQSLVILKHKKGRIPLVFAAGFFLFMIIQESCPNFAGELMY